MEFHLNEIENLAASGDFDKLLSYSHILKLERLEEISSMLESMEDIDYSPVYTWDFDREGFTINNIQIERQEPENLIIHKNEMVSFYDAIKIRQYGHTKISFPNYYLEDIDEFELSDSGINDLDGIQYCIHAVTIDLSDNRITDLRPMENLELVETLNLSENLISDIDSLEYLTSLRELHLANNRIREIEPLFSLANLEFVDLTGNPVSPGVIQKLKEQVAVVEY
jgi:Leucine-rich repeat (LRR) protein